MLATTNDLDSSLLDFARSNAVFSELSPTTIERLLRLGYPVELAPREVLVRQRDRSDCAYLILDGDLDVEVDTAYGAVLVARVSSGALVGEIGVFADLPRNATVRASSAVRALRFDRAHLLEAGNSDPAFLRSIVSRLGSQIGRFNSVIGLYTNAVAALEQDSFDVSILDELKQPSPELVDFAQHFRRMAEQILERRAQQADMASAAAIQRAMLPNAQPSNLLQSQFDVFACMLPARQVGGDLYDIAPLGENQILVSIGDVCGKGVPASLFMAMTQTVMRLTIRSKQDLRAEIGAANKLLVASNREDMFATLFCGVLDLPTCTMQYCNCGHNPPLILRAGTNTFELLRSCGPPLGVADDIDYLPQSTQLAPGDILLLYTDGITEAENFDSLQFGRQRLEKAILEARDRPARGIVEYLVQQVADFSNGAPQSDDITCLAIVSRGCDSA